MTVILDRCAFEPKKRQKNVVNFLFFDKRKKLILL